MLKLPSLLSAEELFKLLENFGFKKTIIGGSYSFKHPDNRGVLVSNHPNENEIREVLNKIINDEKEKYRENEIEKRLEDLENIKERNIKRGVEGGRRLHEKGKIIMEKGGRLNQKKSQISVIKDKKYDPEDIKKHKIDYLYRIEPVENLGSIFEHGLLSNNKIHELGIPHKDISDEEVQERRHKKRDSIYNRPLHDYVPLYFAPTNPMLYKRIDHQKDIVFLCIDPELLLNKDTIFTNGNAASVDTKFYTGTDKLDKLPWDTIRQAYDPYWDYLNGSKRIKCAEILVPLKIPAERIKKIFCNSDEQSLKVSGMMRHNILIPIEVNKNLYYKKSL